MTTISLHTIGTTFGLSNPQKLSKLYSGGSYVPAGVYPATVPINGSGNSISLSNFYGVPAYKLWGSGQQTSPDQPDDGCAWSVEFTNGSSGWGLYVVVAIYGNGEPCNYAHPNGLYGTYQSYFIAKLINTTANYGTQYNGGSGQFYYFGSPWAYWDGASTVYIYGNSGTGLPDDTGYAYATQQVRHNWEVLSQGANYIIVTI